MQPFPKEVGDMLFQIFAVVLALLTIISFITGLWLHRLRSRRHNYWLGVLIPLDVVATWTGLSAIFMFYPNLPLGLKLSVWACSAPLIAFLPAIALKRGYRKFNFYVARRMKLQSLPPARFRSLKGSGR